MRKKNYSYKNQSLPHIRKLFVAVLILTAAETNNFLSASTANFLSTSTATQPLAKSTSATGSNSVTSSNQELLKERATRLIVKDHPKQAQQDKVPAPKTFTVSIGQSQSDDQPRCIDLARLDANSDFRYYSLRSRIRDHLITTFRIKLRHASQVARDAYSLGRFAVFHVEINATDGTLACLKLIQRSGCEELDNTFAAIFESAVPFPTIPESLNIKRYCISELLTTD